MHRWNNPLLKLLQWMTACLFSLVLIVGLSLSHGLVAQAAVDTTSAATKADANNINQRKEDAPHYPNWYQDQRSLESYMDNAGMNSDLADRPATESDRGNLIERSRKQLQNTVDNVRDTLQPSSNDERSNAITGYSRTEYGRSDDSVVTSDDIPDRIGNRLDRAKETFQQATERALEENDTIITGTSNS
ncbi:hypothetical protein [Thermocoleostomius sinensis]|jgi:heat shock protein HspQ|uniref:Uncharacterized protein n=1 Tax=Thermocoleostomius sinensis A174 TaxID=2016057 RepID=A0A9E8ZA82_9CYAN|nr:hypothetical protein [Thermocoleostomius sinensis]WAL58259.1 hypothetical protein OXH18_13800 [Thermocoleostomius sinensis A174]